MYDLKHTMEDPNRFTGTSIGIRGKLWRADMWMIKGEGKMLLEGHTVKAGNVVQDHTTVATGDVDWTPALRPRYYNIMLKPWLGTWIEQTGMRQYKVGWTDRSLKTYPHIGDRQGKGYPLEFAYLAALYEGKTEYHPLARALSMVRRRKDANSVCALSPNLALERGPFSTMYLVYQAQRYVGIVHDGALLVDNTFNHPELAGMEYEHAEVKKLTALLSPPA